MMPVSWRLSRWEKISYALGDSASNFYWKTFEYFLVFYYTDVFGLPAATVGTMMLVTRAGDAVIDPLMGILADRTHTRWGRFRPYLLWFPIPLAAAGVLTFTTPHINAGGKAIYAYVTYSLLMLMYTAVNIPYTALMGVMTSNSIERTSLSSLRFIGAFVVTVFVQKFTLSLVVLLGHGDNAHGWQATMLLYGLFAVLMFLTCFTFTCERIVPPVDQKTNLKLDLGTVITSRPWQVLFISVIFVLASYAVRGAASAYYFKYYVNREDMLGWFLVANGVSNLLGIVITPWVAKAVGKKRGFMLATGAGALLFGLLYVASPTNLPLIFGLQAISSFAIGPAAPLFFAMYADIADHVEWVTARRATGLIFASAMFAIKFGAALGGWVIGLLLAFFGYVANGVQTSNALRGIGVSISVVPGILLALASVVFAAYELDERTMSGIEADLATRRELQRAPVTF
jgi:glycoside/pentoside/hexuronide:cation symporter, GPH family